MSSPLFSTPACIILHEERREENNHQIVIRRRLKSQSATAARCRHWVSSIGLVRSFDIVCYVPPWPTPFASKAFMATTIYLDTSTCLLNENSMFNLNFIWINTHNSLRAIHFLPVVIGHPKIKT